MSFKVKEMNSKEVALRLDNEASIIVRSGHHCSIPLMKYLGLGVEGKGFVVSV